MAATQNWPLTCSWARRTAIAAVVSGMNAAITAACADVVRCRARARRIAQPKTAPSIVKNSGRRYCLGGIGTRRTRSTTTASVPAITARPMAVKNGLKPPTATLVRGREKEKSRTPSMAHRSPARTMRAEASGASVVLTCRTVPGLSARGRAR